MDKKWLAGGVVVVVAAGVGAGVVIAQQSDDEDDVPITGAELDEATNAALAYTGEGRVTGTEVGDEESYYEVEVTLNDGSQVDVQLDRDFKVVSSEADGADDDEGADDD